MPVLLYVLWFLALVQGLVSLRDGRRNLAYVRNYRRGSAPPPGAVVVFCPVRGSAPDLAANAESLMFQSHPNYRVVFIVESEADPAFPVLSGLASPRAEVLVAGQTRTRGQKVHNLAAAVERSGADAPVLVFADADACFPASWLLDLVRPLADPGVGATTGFRWYVAAGRASFSERLLSAWNASAAGFLGLHSNNFAWGGSTAIRRETFARTHVLDDWAGALSDDYVLTRAVRRAGLQVRYVPACLVPSRAAAGWSELLEFTTRQIRITRVYSPAVWRLALVSYTLFNLTFFWLAANLGRGAAPVLMWLGLYLLAGVRADARVEGARMAIPDAASGAMRVFHIVAPPLVSLLYQGNLIASLLSRRIRWKGIRYTMVSAEQTRVDRG